GSRLTELTVAHVACTSWWQDVFNAFGRIGDRDDLDLVTHAGDHVYDGSGGHPASRFHAGQTRWDTDLDNKDWQTVAECRRRYALYYADRNLLRAHLAAPFAIMPDQHDDDPSSTDGKVTISQTQASEVFYEWTATRPTVPDGSGRFRPSPGPDTNVAVPQGRDALYHYRVLPYGALAEVVLFDIRRFAERPGDTSKVLGDVQWAWLERVLRSTKARGITHRLLVQQVNLAQLRAFNLPFADQFEQQLGMSPNAPQGELYTTGWGAHPGERARLFRFLRREGLLDNVVVSGDSHGFFASDLVEDGQAPNYEPATGGGLLGAVGVEIVPSTQGRPGGQDVIAEMLYFAANNGSRGAAYNDAATYDSVYRTQALPALLALEQAGMAANPHLRYFNWKAEYGYSMVHLRADKAVLECWTTPQRVVGTGQRLLAQFSSPIGAPHLNQALMPTPAKGSRRDAPAPSPSTVRSRPGRRA
ncbi:MAG: alkaline phosphatase D family protein, partial [Frankiales bacterium]|nr:alkaline phosphatase D family protein [Frankiales bacterium]